MASKRYLICYDIADPGRLRRVARALESYGTRIQYSIFECFLTDALLATCKADLDELMVKEEDQALFISLKGDHNDDNLVISALGKPYTRRSLVTII